MPTTDEEIVRDLLHRYTDQVRPPAAIATWVVTHQRKRERQRTVAVAATCVSLGTAAGVIAVVPGHSSNALDRPSASGGAHSVIRLTADQKALYHLSSVAAGQPRGRARYAVMSTEGRDVKDTTIIDSRTGNMWSYQKGTDGTPSGQGYTPGYSLTSAKFAAMPTGVAALRAALIAEWNREHKWHSEHKVVAHPARKGPVPVPRPVLTSDDDIVFQQASDLLWNPLVPPALRSALYKVLATVPGVTVNSSARDAIGRAAVKISRTDDSGLPSGKSDGVVYATYESPATGAVLESTVTYPPGSDVVTPQNPHGKGTVVDMTVYLSVTWARSVPGNPYRS